MSEPPESWELRQDETLLGRLTIYDEDMFWYSAHFEPTPDFEPYRPIFNEGAAIRTTDDANRWNAWYEQVRGLGLKLVRRRDNEKVSEFILYIQGREADFRPRFDNQISSRNEKID